MAASLVVLAGACGGSVASGDHAPLDASAPDQLATATDGAAGGAHGGGAGMGGITQGGGAGAGGIQDASTKDQSAGGTGGSSPSDSGPEVATGGYSGYGDWDGGGGTPGGSGAGGSYMSGAQVYKSEAFEQLLREVLSIQ